jgi:hypothetical protein
MATAFAVHDGGFARMVERAADAAALDGALELRWRCKNA